MWVSSELVGQPREPSRKTMYDPMKAVKNMISVPRNSHIPSFEFGMGIPIFRATGFAECDMAFKTIPKVCLNKMRRSETKKQDANNQQRGISTSLEDKSTNLPSTASLADLSDS